MIQLTRNCLVNSFQWRSFSASDFIRIRSQSFAFPPPCLWTVDVRECGNLIVPTEHSFLQQLHVRNDTDCVRCARLLDALHFQFVSGFGYFAVERLHFLAQQRTEYAQRILVPRTVFECHFDMYHQTLVAFGQWSYVFFSLFSDPDGRPVSWSIHQSSSQSIENIYRERWWIFGNFKDFNLLIGINLLLLNISENGLDVRADQPRTRNSDV